MDESSSGISTRRGTPGLDIFKIAGRSISGFLPSFKTGDTRQVRQPFTTQLEERLALYLEYHPHVRSYQRGDASEAFAQARHLHTPLGTPYRIPYLYDGKPHEYLPDFVGTLCDGGLLIAEAGRDGEKRKGQAVAKAEVASRLAIFKGGAYWIGTDENLSVRRHSNLLFLHARRRSFSTHKEIAQVVLAHWTWGNLSSVNELVQLFGRRWSDAEVEAAVWKLAGDAAAEGQLLVDLTSVLLDRETPLSLLDPSDPPILPDLLPSTLEQDDQSSELPMEHSSEEPAPVGAEPLSGPTFDASTLESDEERERFYRNLAAVTAVLAGEPRRRVAKQYQMHPFTLARLEQRVQQFGQRACVPYATYHRERTLRPEFQELLRKLYTLSIRPTMMAVYEDVQLQQLATQLSEQENMLVKTPTYKQVKSFLKGIAQEPAVIAARVGTKHHQPERTSASSFVLSIPYPAHLCQVDEHTMDLFVTTLDGTVITRRVHAAVLICVKTAAILGAVLALDALCEGDYMRLVKMAIEPKDRLTALYECQHPWLCYGKPSVIFHDRGKIFTSERATQVLVDRLGIVTEQAPPFAPSAKGTVESLFTWVTRKFTHRLPGTTKATPVDRGMYNSAREAEKAGITLDVLEKLFIQAIVDGYMQEWDKLRRAKRSSLWEDAVQKTGIPRFMGSPDDLKLLLMKAVNRKNPATGHYAITQGRLSFLGRSYVSPGLLDRLRGREIDIYFDQRDISVIYLFLEGELVGEAYCTEFLHRRVSIWEATAERRADRAREVDAKAISLANRQHIQEEAQAGRRIHVLETKRLEKQRQLDGQRQEIHPSHVQATLQALKEQLDSSLSPPTKRSSLLPPAIPEDDPPDTEIVPLPVRKLRKDDD